MPSFVLSLALLLLVLLTLLAVSNRELIALTFLGFSTVALPLSIWIGGAIALGFLLGLWILLLFRFGAVGWGGSPAPDKRRANYGPEDFAVVDDRFTEGADRYDDGRYGENRYDDDIYVQGQAGTTASRGDDQQPYVTDRDYSVGKPQSDGYGSAEGYGSADAYDSADAYETDRYGRTADDYETEQRTYRDRPERQNQPQDRFSAASGYESTQASRNGDETQPHTEPIRSATDPTIPADWDDQYREDWSPEELVPEPVLRNEETAPKLKRLFRQSGEGRPKLNLGGFGFGAAAESGAEEGSNGQPGEAERSPNASGEVSDWQGADQSSDRDDRSAYEPSPQAQGDVYDADYRVLRQPEDQAEPRPRREAPAQPNGKEAQKSDRSQSEWDIESDLDW